MNLAELASSLDQTPTEGKVVGHPSEEEPTVRKAALSLLACHEGSLPGQWMSKKGKML